MKKLIIFVTIFVLCISAVFSQEDQSTVEIFERNFARASISTKLGVLESAANLDNPELGRLYSTAIKFILGNQDLLATDSVMIDIASLSANMIQKLNYTAAIDDLWALFTSFKDNRVRIPVLNALSVVGKGNDKVIEQINNFLGNQVSIKAAINIDLATLDAAINTLGALKSPTSFKFLFSAYTADFNNIIKEHAKIAMDSLDGEYDKFLLEIIENQAPSDKALALVAGLESKDIPDDRKADIALKALEIGVNYSTANTEDQIVIQNLRVAAIKELTKQKWQKASSAAIKHFTDFQILYNRNQVTKSNLQEAIACLGVMGTPEAALALSNYLQLINTITEEGTVFDEQITLAVIKNLGILADKVAFEHLIYIGYLQYSDNVKQAAHEALQNIKL